MSYEAVKNAIAVALGVGAILGWGVKIVWIDPLETKLLRELKEDERVDLLFCHFVTTRLNKIEKKTGGTVNDTKICDYLRKKQ